VNKEDKQKIVSECQQILKDAKVVVFTDFRGLNVLQMSKLRRDLHQGGSDCWVVKNTLIERAARDIDSSAVPNMFVGPTGMVYAFDDPVKPVKVLRGFAADNPNLKVKGALLSGKVVNGSRTMAIADLPSREVLLSRLLMRMNSPAANLVSVLQGNTIKLLATLKAIGEKKAAAV